MQNMANSRQPALVEFSTEDVENGAAGNQSVGYAGKLLGRCNGHGVCRQCRCRIVRGTVLPDAGNLVKNPFNLPDGEFLACQAAFVPGGDLIVERIAA